MVRTEEPGTAVSVPLCLIGADAGVLSPERSAALGRIRAAAVGGEFAEAGRFAAELHQAVLDAEGAEHSDAPAVQEVRAYLAHRAGDHRGAADLYERTAAAWAFTGAGAVRPAIINARACWALAGQAAAAGRPTARSRAAALLAGRAARRCAVVAAVAGVLSCWAVELAAEERHRPASAAERVELAAAPVLRALAGMPSAASVRPPAARAPEPFPAQPSGRASDPSPAQPSVRPPEQDRESDGAGADEASVRPPGRSAVAAVPSRPRPARTPAGVPSQPPVRPARSAGQPSPAGPQPTVPVDVCAESGKVGLPPGLVEICRKAYGR
ncbi:hypothetical protein ABZW30_45830 [Kitasatospora sp. NPDC004669]|uniref:hypothetical protein n=1 Tax=Kitasatospora sp. NPDC004669 TaxID=3154555 RepID=UPI0033A37A0A